MHRALGLRRSRRLSIALGVVVAGVVAGTALGQVHLGEGGVTELCFSPVTCVPPHDNIGTPEPLGTDTNLPSDIPTLPVGGLACPLDDLISNIRADYAIGGLADRIKNATPQEAIAQYFRSSTLPAGLLAADWEVVNVTSLSANASVLERLSAQDRPRILGRMGIERFSNSWHVVWMRACGEYLYPGSTTLAGVADGSVKSSRSQRMSVKRARAKRALKQRKAKRQQAVRRSHRARVKVPTGGRD